MPIFKIYPYKMSSQSAKNLAQSLEAKRIRQESRTYHPRNNQIVINWGNSNLSTWMRYTFVMLNNPQKVEIACNKLLTFKTLKLANIPTPEWTQNPETADNWVQEGSLVFGRKTLTGHSGQGITLFNEELHIPRDICPLYTKYTKCKYEYRVHVMNGHIIDFVQKKKREGIEANPHIRSHAHGWIFARENVELPEIVKTTAIKAVQALGLDFGAVDIGYNVRHNQAFVYEINTAPALEGTTLQRYTEGFKTYYGNNHN